MSRSVVVIVLACVALGGLAARSDSRAGGFGATDIVVVNVSGTGKRNLTAGSNPARRVLRTLSPDGRAVAFDQLRVEDNTWFWSIRLVPTRGGEQRTLIRYPGASAYDPAWSRNGKLIAFETCCLENRGVRVQRSDGTEVSRIPDSAEPAWLAGPRLAFLAGGDVHQEVATVKPDGSGRTTILYARPFEEFDELESSSNGRRFAFSAAGHMKSDERDVYSGSVAYGLLGQVSSDAWSSSWSPSSRRLVFETSRGLVTARPDGSERRRFPATERLYPAVPSWSPDGTRVAFIGGNASSSLFVLNVRHRALRMVVSGGVDKQRPVWSRDGRRLFYASRRGS